MYASSGNKHFFTKYFHRQTQTYQNYEQSRQKLGAILGKKSPVHVVLVSLLVDQL